MNGQRVQILMIEDNPGDVVLAKQGLKAAKVANEIHVAVDGIEGLRFLRKEGEYANVPQPDLIFLDLNLPRMDGRQVLAEIKGDPSLKHIPVVVLTSSEASQDVAKAYDLHANCYVTKPVGLQALTEVVRSIDNFWLSVVKLPGNK
jgi:two-component system, chemotaxis family, response regulator Rcp1